MKRYLIVGVLIGIIGAVAFFGITGVVLAQKPTPATPGQGWGMMGGAGRGMMGAGRGGMMGGYGAQGTGLMQDYMQKELAAKLGISVDDLQKAYADGKTFWQVAQDKGYTTEQAQQMMIDARNAALDKMVADGTITQAQADFMKNRMNGGMMGGYGRGGCMGGWDNDDTNTSGTGL